jgi:hypothetical protein
MALWRLFSDIPILRGVPRFTGSWEFWRHNAIIDGFMGIVDIRSSSDTINE